MVHQTMNSRAARASIASRKSSSMMIFRWAVVAILGMLAGCASTPLPPAQPAAPPGAAPAPGPVPAVNALATAKARWVPVAWSELPGFADDNIYEAWNAWLKGCERPPANWVRLCGEVRQLSIASAQDQRAWMMAKLQPYRVEPLDGAAADGLLTGYYEPQLDATRLPTASSNVPLYRPPATLAQRRPWYTREEIDTLPEARAQLRGREIAYVSDPLDALMVQVQGSARLRITEAGGAQRLVRLAYAGTNDQPYRSVATWLLQQGALRDASWAGLKAWAQQNPQRINELLWSNPRYVFFREEPLSDVDAVSGPRGALGVPLTPGRSIAVDRDSIPYGTPVWLASSGPAVNLQRLVFAQDTGNAITGAVRADFFTGWGNEAGELAGRLKQPLRLWALWPR
ncbi:MAG TPA: MltA domain-containing protein [Ramlibacter sp.]